jgi:N-hydroxyarylamine O-acetyltransferase
MLVNAGASLETVANGKMLAMDVGAYLDRIGYAGSREPTLATLRGIHRAQMLSVPFENLDIFGSRRHVYLDEPTFFAKVVGERRGGFCYELNGLFAALLRELGFEVDLLSARVMKGNREGPEFDHLALLVRAVDSAGRWLADVGFGDSSLVPLDLDEPGPQGEPEGGFRIEDAGAYHAMWARTEAGKWVERYRFSLVPHLLEDFAGMCEYHQTSPDSHFTQNRVCSMPNAAGRITLSGNRLTVVQDGQRTLRRLADDAEFSACLREHFGMDLVLGGPGRE